MLDGETMLDKGAMAEIRRIRELERTQAVYSWFTLEEWKFMAESIFFASEMSPEMKRVVLSKFPSASLEALSIDPTE